jgi:two-component system OmpR family response regulator
MAESRILLVEDDTKISESIVKGLTDVGFAVDVAFDGESALAKAHGNRYDLLLLDLMLPKKDGLSVLRELRSSGEHAKILILSAKRNVDDRVAGLEIGADDYLTKPFVFQELIARCRALLRRDKTKRSASETKLVSGIIELDLVGRVAAVNGKSVELRPKEFCLLEYFIRNQGQILTKDQILAQIWRYNFDPQTNVVDVLVCRLRNKIQDPDAARLIKTIRGMGYVYNSL